MAAKTIQNFHHDCFSEKHFSYNNLIETFSKIEYNERKTCLYSVLTEEKKKIGSCMISLIRKYRELPVLTSDRVGEHESSGIYASADASKALANSVIDWKLIPHSLDSLWQNWALSATLG